MGQFSSVPSSTSSFRPICVFCLDTNNVKQCNHPRCKSCDIRFKTYELFVSHKNEKHPQCELCNEVFENKEMFDAHYVLCNEKHEIKCLEIANTAKIKIEKQKELKSIRQKEFDKKQNKFFEQYKNTIDEQYKSSMTHIEVGNLMIDIIKMLREYEEQNLDEINQYERFGGGCFNDDKFIDIDDIIERIQVYITEKFV